MLDQIYAKSGERRETLTEHTENVLGALSMVKERTVGFSEDFWKACSVMCLFHDAGKITENFQDVLDGKYDENIRHEMLSGTFLLTLSRDFFEKYSLQTIAVYTHHKRLNVSLFDKDENKVLRLSYSRIQDWFTYALSHLKQLGVTYSVPGASLEKLGSWTAAQHKHHFVRFYSHFKPHWSAKDRIAYIFPKSILNIADWSASGHFDLPPALEFDSNYLKDHIESKLRDEGKLKLEDAITFRKFQKESKVDANVIAVAPTGSGKTEAALLWASQKSGFDKIIYCLPTRVTSNAIYKRIATYFGEENCAVVHSSALLYQKQLDEDFESTKYLRDKTFFKNVSVCTIDQILTQGFNLGFWEVKTFHCQNARIIIDEIHLYTPYTLALILNTIKYLRENFNAQFFIMSATMPTKLQALLAEALGEDNYQTVQDHELLANSRNNFEIREVTVQENIKELKGALQKYNKVLVVVNTVDQAINLYRELKPAAEDKLCVCFHSRFIQKDRFAKEKKILDAEKDGKPIILIATQVVEVSLDIDFDVLFTENAPIDALVQRAGRVNRSRTKKNSRVIVHRHSPVSSEFVYTEQDILDKTFEILKQYDNQQITESLFLELVDEVYQDIDVTEKLSFKEGEKAYREVQSNHFYLGDVNPENEEAVTRNDMDSVSVIPGEFYEMLQPLRKWQKAEYELSIRKWRFLAAKMPQDKDGFNYVNYPYDAELGLIFPEKDSPTSQKVFRSF